MITKTIQLTKKATTGTAAATAKAASHGSVASSNSTASSSSTTSSWTHFVFAYGSLICPHSRALTTPTLACRTALPVLAKGIERMWAKRVQHRGMTAMGVRFQEDAKCVGVLLPVTESELLLLDKRETGYKRFPLVLDQVDTLPFLHDKNVYDDSSVEYQLLQKAKCEKDKSSTVSASKYDQQQRINIWVYVQKKPIPPSPDAPIVQSYVDTILRGCLGIDEQFAAEFIRTTKGWHPEEFQDSDQSVMNLPNDSTVEPDDDDDDSESTIVWVDDRHKPIYPRGDPTWSRQQARKIDNLLRKYRPGGLSRRQQLHHPHRSTASKE